jgi:hypothetical protein
LYDRNILICSNIFHLKIIYNSRLYTFHERQQEVQIPTLD